MKSTHCACRRVAGSLPLAWRTVRDLHAHRSHSPTRLFAIAIAASSSSSLGELELLEARRGARLVDVCSFSFSASFWLWHWPLFLFLFLFLFLSLSHPVLSAHSPYTRSMAPPLHSTPPRASSSQKLLLCCYRATALSLITIFNYCKIVVAKSHKLSLI